MTGNVLWTHIAAELVYGGTPEELTERISQILLADLLESNSLQPAYSKLNANSKHQLLDPIRKKVRPEVEE